MNYLKRIESILVRKAVLGFPVLMWTLLIALMFLKMFAYGSTLADIMQELVDWSFAGILISFMITVTAGIPILHVALRKIKEV